MQSRDALASCSQPVLFQSRATCHARPSAPGTRANLDYGVGDFLVVSPFADPFIADESLVGAGVEPAAMCALSLLRRLSLMLDPLCIPPMLSVAAGATEPPAVDVSVALVLSPFAQAARQANVTTIANRFMKPSREIMNRERRPVRRDTPMLLGS